MIEFVSCHERPQAGPAISQMIRRRWESGGQLEETQRLAAFLELQTGQTPAPTPEGLKC